MRAKLKFTMLPPQTSRSESGSEDADADEWAAPNLEAMELPLGVRLAQIGSGIGIFLAVSRWGSRLLIFLIGEKAEANTTGQAIYLFAFTAFIYVAAALAGGIVAGAWSVNWVPQGVGVGIGVLAIPLIFLVLFQPESVPLYLIGVLVTTVLTVLGALLGHKIIRPSQFVT
jgi:hypothetical protein